MMEILLIEDSPSDVLLTQEALAPVAGGHTLHVVDDGVDAMAFLRQKGSYAAAPRPDLILLDLNLPGKNGREVLAEIKTDANLQVIPVLVLTTSQDARDVDAAYRLHANCYIRKSIHFEQFAETIKDLVHFWGAVVTLPL